MIEALSIAGEMRRGLTSHTGSSELGLKGFPIICSANVKAATVSSLMQQQYPKWAAGSLISPVSCFMSKEGKAKYDRGG
jgi:hypothetical protein